MTTYTPGDVVTLSAVFLNTSGAPTNPSNVALYVKDPFGNTTNNTPTNDSAGNYHFDLSVPNAGVYNYRWVGTGTVTTTQEGAITVAPSSVSNTVN